jgi:predicted RNA-binding protein Jag
MEQLQQKINQMMELMGFQDFKIEVQDEKRLIAVMIYDQFLTPERLQEVIPHFTYLIRLMAKQMNVGPIIVDVNNYREERERIIIDLAKAAARRAVATNAEVELPPMNSYERRLIHAELATRPDIATESKGEGKDRHVTIKVI